jgi:hypothetical protein
MNKHRKFLFIPIISIVNVIIIVTITFFVTEFIIGHLFYPCQEAEAFRMAIGRDRTSILPGIGLTDIGSWPAQDLTGVDLLPAYAQTSWPTIHRDSKNSNYIPFITASQLRMKWRALDGEYSSVLTAAVIGPEGNIYFTTGKEESYGNLHAFDQGGKELWRSYLLDNGALCSSPVIDKQGDLYLGDSDEFFAFHPDGNLKWECSEVEGPFASAAFSLDGYIICIGTNGWVYVLDPHDGHLVVPPLELPGQSPGNSYKVLTPPGLWKGMVSDEVHLTCSDIFNGLMGYEFKITNTPAVNPVNGRIYIAGTIRGPAFSDIQGRFYGIDFIPATSSAPAKLQMAFQTEMGPGSGSSPSISPDGSHLYVLDNKGTIYAFDKEGNKVWTLPIKSSPASPTIGQDGTIYGTNRDQIYAITDKGNSGQIQWQLDLNNTVVGSLLGSLPFVSHDENSTQRIKSSMQCNSVVSTSKNHLYFAVALGYELVLQEDTNFSYLYPLKNLLVVLNLSDKQQSSPPIINSVVEIPDTSESVVSLDKNGTAFCAHGSVSSSIAYSVAQKMGLNPKKPVGGISVLAPSDPKDIVRSQIKMIRDFISMAIQALRQGKPELARASLGEPMEQLKLMEENFSTQIAAGEGDVQMAQKGQEETAKMHSQLGAALSILEGANSGSNNTNTSGVIQRRQGSGSMTSNAKSCLRSASSTCRYMQLLFSNLQDLQSGM